MRIQCPSVSVGVSTITHEPCTRCASWWDRGSSRCTAQDTIPAGRLRRPLPCELESSCRWARQSAPGICAPMRLGEVCEHQGGEFNAFDFEAAP